MIPHIIHYCWFGGSPHPEYVKKCIASWRRFFPDYEIKEWNESNFDVNMMAYTRNAYEAKKYAFVSDAARFWILSHEGGIYFDADVEVIKSFDDILENGPFMGTEVASRNGSYPLINSGLGIACEPGNPVVRAIYEHYKKAIFPMFVDDSARDTVVTHTTGVLVSEFGLQPNNEIQKLDGMTIYPIDFFNPFNDLTGVLTKTENTHSIHWFAKTWTDKPMWYYRITRVLHRIFGVSVFATIKKFLSFGR